MKGPAPERPAAPELTPLRIVVGSDRAGHPLKEALAQVLRAHPLVSSVLDVGVDRQGRTPYPKIAQAAARRVADATSDRALLICHTGLGVAIAANKVRGIRAVTAHDVLSVRAAVESNDAQVLALGAGVVGPALARHLVEQWLLHRFDPMSSAARKVQMITAFERGCHDVPRPM